MFRTIAVRAGRALNWTWHYRRLSIDCALLGIAAPPETLVAGEVARVARESATVKVIVTRGSGGRGYGMAPGVAPTRIVAAFASASVDPARATEGVTVRRCALVLSEQPRVAGAKTLNRLENVLARSEWDDPSIAEGVLVDAGGHVIEGTMSNLFLVRRGRVATPDLARCGVVGAQRERVRELLARAGIDCDVRDIDWAGLEDADEVFLTNSLIGAWPVTKLGERRWAPGTITRRVQALIAEHDARA